MSMNLELRYLTVLLMMPDAVELSVCIGVGPCGCPISSYGVLSTSPSLATRRSSVFVVRMRIYYASQIKLHIHSMHHIYRHPKQEAGCENTSSEVANLTQFHKPNIMEQYW